MSTNLFHSPRPRAATLAGAALIAFSSAPLLLGCQRERPTLETLPEPVVSVTTTEVSAIDSPRRLSLTGTLRGARETELAANVSGRVMQTRVERGQRIEKGQVIAQVDVQNARLALAEARVSVETSKTQQEINATECARYERLKGGGVITDLEYDQVTAKCRTAPLNLEAARARESLAAKNVGDGVIRSPFAGVVSERYVEVGEYVQPSSRVVSLAEVDELRLLFSVSERNYPDIKPNAEVWLHVAAYEDQVFSGRVVHISGAVRDTRDVVVEAVVNNEKRLLLPGMFAAVELVIGTEKLPSVPRSATFEANGRRNLFVVREGRLEQRVVQAVRDVGDRTPIRHGLAVGELVVQEPDPALENGQKVE